MAGAANPFDQFDQTAASQAAASGDRPDAPAPPNNPFDAFDDHAEGPARGIGPAAGRIAEATREGFGPEPANRAPFAPETEAFLAKHGIVGPALNAVGSIVDLAKRDIAAGYRGAQQTAVEALTGLGVPAGAAQELVRVPEAFAGEIPGAAEYAGTAQAFRGAAREAANARPSIITPTPTPEAAPPEPAAMPAPTHEPPAPSAAEPPAIAPAPPPAAPAPAATPMQTLEDIATGHPTPTAAPAPKPTSPMPLFTPPPQAAAPAPAPPASAPAAPPAIAPSQPEPAKPEPPPSVTGKYVMVDPDALTLDPKRFQFKTADEKGVTGALQGVKQWEPDLADPVMAYQDTDGKLYVVNGHQRTNLAQSAKAAGQPNVQVPAEIYRAEDGYTPDFMRALGAYRNIAQGSGSPLDAARVLRSAGSLPPGVRLPDLPPKSALVRDATGLAQLAPDAFGMVENGHVPPEFAALVGAQIHDPTEQVAALDVLARANPANATQAAFMVKDIQNAGFLRGSQTTLFGDEELSKSLVPERARVLDNALRVVRRNKSVFRAAVEGEDTLAGAGNQMSREGNAAGKAANERLVEILQRDATTRGPVSDALTAAAGDIASGKPIGAATTRFLTTVRALDRRGQATGLPAGDHGSGPGDAGEAEPGPELGFAERRKLPLPPSSGTDLLGHAAPEPRAARVPEPTIRNDQRQQVMPGMEPTAVQAQAARDQAGRGALTPKAPQQAADEGLFARQETPQPALPMARPISGSMADDFRAFQQQTGLPAHEAAAAYVMQRGLETGHEYLTAYDPHTDAVVLAHTEGKTNEVEIPEGRLLLAVMADPTQALVFHHNHPESSSLSDTDLLMLSNPGVSQVVAHAHDGQMYAASLQGSAPARHIQRQYNAVLGSRKQLFQARVAVGILPYQQANAILSDLIMRDLHKRGVIDYMTTAAPSAEAIDAGLHRHTPVRSAERIAAVAARASEHAAGRMGASADRGSGTVAQNSQGNGGDEEAPSDRSGLSAPNGRFAEGAGDGEVGRFPGVGHWPEQRPPGERPPTPEMPPDSLWGGGYRPPPLRPKSPVDPSTMARRSQTKNLNAVERYAIMSRTLASLDDMSAHYWNEWQGREREGSTNVDTLRQDIAQTFLKLPKDQQARVVGALELGRIQGANPTDAAGNVIARNMTVPFARWSQVGDTLALTPEESAAYRDMVELGRHQWDMLMHAKAKQYGWTGEINPTLIRAAAGQAEASSASGKGGGRAMRRLADLLDAMRAQQQDIYVPFQRYGSHYISVRPIHGDAMVEGLGGRPPLAWFETIEPPALQNVVGVSSGRFSVQAAAEKRITELRQQFPPDRFAIEHGDFSRTPGLLRKLDIPAIEKLMMLMEQGVKKRIFDQVAGEEGGPTTKAGIRAEAASRYDQLHGEAIQAFEDELFEQLKAGYRRKANVVPGYSADFGRAIGSHMYQIARNSADMVHRDRVESAFTQIQDYHPHRPVADWWKRWRDYQENQDDVLTRLANGVNQVGLAYVLGMNPSSTLIMAAHTPLMAAPVLSVGIGPAAASGALMRGLAAAYKGLSFDRQHGGTINLERSIANMPPAKQVFMRKMDAEGRLAGIGAQDLGRLNERQSALWGEQTGTVHRALEIATSNLTAVDQANRIGIASAAWDIASDPKKLDAAARPLMLHNAIFRDMVDREGLSPETFGRFMLSEAALEWGKQSRAEWMRGFLGTLLGSLHGFQVRYLSTAFRLMKNMGPHGRLALLFMMGALGLGAGLTGLPFTKDAESVGDALGKRLTGMNPGIDHQLRSLLADSGMGSVGSQIIMDGPLSWLGGLELGSRIGFGDVLSRQLDSGNILGTMPWIMWGAYSNARERAASGQNAAAVASEAAPFASRGPLRALAASDQGVVSRSGKTTYAQPGEVSGADLARMATGFTPLSVANAQRERERYYQAQQDLPAVEAMIRNGDRAGAVEALQRMGWSPRRIREYERYILHPRAVSPQFQRWESQQRVAP